MMSHTDGPAPDAIESLDPEGMHVLDRLIPELPRSRNQSTGPKTKAGKERSRANAVKHGLCCKIVEPDDQAPKIAERIEAWTGALQPADEIQHWLVSRAAIASVRLDRCAERENIALGESTARAEKDFLRRRRAWARRTGSKLRDQPKKAFALLNGSAFGCHWLIDRWDDLAAELEDSDGYWSRDEFLQALAMLGLDSDPIPTGKPAVAQLYRAYLAADPEPWPEVVEAFLGLDTGDLYGDERDAAVRQALGNSEDGRKALLAFAREEQARLRKLRNELWEAVDRQALEQACLRSRTFDACPEAALAQRYETAQSIDLHRHLNGFYRARRESEKHQEDATPRSVPAPNELHNGQDCVVSTEDQEISANPSPASPASPERPQGVAEASSERRQDVPKRDNRTARKAIKEARKRSRRKGR